MDASVNQGDKEELSRGCAASRWPSGVVADGSRTGWVSKFEDQRCEVGHHITNVDRYVVQEWMRRGTRTKSSNFEATLDTHVTRLFFAKQEMNTHGGGKSDRNSIANYGNDLAAQTRKARCLPSSVFSEAFLSSVVGTSASSSSRYKNPCSVPCTYTITPVHPVLVN